MPTLEKKARFDTRISKEQKSLFERAAQIGGYRSLTDFMILAAQQRAKEIIEESDKIIVSKRDSDVFFEAITNPSMPNKELVTATENYIAKLSQ